MGVDQNPVEHSIEQLDDLPTSFDHAWWRVHDFSVISLLILLLVACGLLTWLYRPLFQPVEANATPIFTPNSGSQFAQTANMLYFIERPAGMETTDIFMRPITTTEITATNLTLSPNYSELQPVVAPNLQQLAYVTISQGGDRSLRVLQPGHVAADITYQTGTSGLKRADCRLSLNQPPVWSPDSQWLAYLIECGFDSPPAIYVMAARASGIHVKQASRSGQPVANLSWQDDNTLIFSEQQPGNKEAICQVSIVPDLPVPVLINTVPAGN